MQLSDITVEVRDINLARKGLILPAELDLRADISFNNVGVWTLKLATDHPMASVLRTPGSGLIVTGPSDVLFSGPTIKPTLTASVDSPFGDLSISGVTDDVVIADQLAYPQPTNPVPTTQTVATDKRTGIAEDLMHAYVNANVGPGAPAARRGKLASKLVMGVNGHRGPTTTKTARFAELGPLLSDLALVGNLGFRVVQRGTQLSFETYQIVDRSKMIRLDILNNTLASQELSINGPTATQIIVAGQGVGVNRAFYAGSNAAALAGEASWGRRIERFVDQRQTDDANEYVQAANEVLADEGSEQVVVKATPMDDTTMRFGVDWNLGDKVATVIDAGEYAAPVTTMILQVDSSGFRTGVSLGDPAKLSAESAALASVAALNQRIAALERGV